MRIIINMYIPVLRRSMWAHIIVGYRSIRAPHHTALHHIRITRDPDAPPVLRDAAAAPLPTHIPPESIFRASLDAAKISAIGQGFGSGSYFVCFYF